MKSIQNIVKKKKKIIASIIFIYILKLEKVKRNIKRRKKNLKKRKVAAVENQVEEIQ